MQLERLDWVGEVLPVCFGTLLLVAGMLALRRSWSLRGARIFTLAGWAAIILCLVLFIYSLGGEVGTAYALFVGSLVAVAVVVTGIELRPPAKASDVRALAPEPEERRTNWRRVFVKSLLAIVISGTAAIGIGVAFAVTMPMSPIDNIVIGALLVPVLWGSGMAWTLYDPKLARVSAVLVSFAVISFAVAFLPGVLV